MTKSELLELIANGENSGVEFKRDDVRPEQLAKEVVALANFQGGRILLGVDDDGTITGIQRRDLEHWVMDTVFGRTVHPMILPFYEEIQIDDQQRMVVISFRMVHQCARLPDWFFLVTCRDGFCTRLEFAGWHLTVRIKATRRWTTG
jgi:predicted HTH transcriptional regulator